MNVWDCPVLEPNLNDWEEMVEALRSPTQEVTIALVGKYIQLHDAYISVVEALKHGGISQRATVNIKWIDSETVTDENVSDLLADADGILVPGGFGDRGIEGKIRAIRLCQRACRTLSGPLSWYAACHRGICKKYDRICRCTQRGAESFHHPIRSST